MSSIATNEFREALLMSLEEVFTNVRGFMLDTGTSLFETLATISAEEASQRVSSQGASLAAQVNHARFYIDALLAGPPAEGQPPHDWAGSWAIEAVTNEEWLALIERLRGSYEKAREFAQTYEGWNAWFMAGAFGLVAHSAYHLGEIRSGIAVIRDRALA
jgi:hypothetical protein